MSRILKYYSFQIRRTGIGHLLSSHATLGCQRRSLHNTSGTVPFRYSSSLVKRSNNLVLVPDTFFLPGPGRPEDRRSILCALECCV